MSGGEAKPTIAWLGLGRMGVVMATRLLRAGFEVGVWNRSPGKDDALLAEGAVRIETLADAGHYDLAYSMVLDDAALARLHDRADGLLAGDTTRLATWIDGSTVSTHAAADAAAAARAAGVGYVAAPVSGNPGVVAAGRAIFAASGADADLERAEPVLGALGRAVHRVGHGVEANVVKLATNGLLGIVMQSLAELVVLGEKAGVPRAELLAFINDSAVGSPFSNYKTAALVDLDFTPTFTVEGQRKDLRLALGLAAELETPMPVLSTTEVAFSRTVSSGVGAGMDLAAVLLAAARDAGLDLQRPD